MQGMSGIVFQLLTVFDHEIFESFLTFSNLIVCRKLLRDLFTFDHASIETHAKEIHRLVRVFHEGRGIEVDSIIELASSSLYSIYTSTFTPPTAAIVWDMYFVLGDEFLYKLTAFVCAKISKDMNQDQAMSTVEAKEKLLHINICDEWRLMCEVYNDY